MQFLKVEQVIVMNRLWWILGLVGLGYGLGLEPAIAKPLPIIGNIKDQDIKAFEGGAGCTFSRKVGTGIVFLSSVDEKGPAAPLMNIRGKARKLRLVSGVNENKSNPNPQKGDRSTYIYKSGKVTVKLNLVATRVCPANGLATPAGDYCETTDYDAKITVLMGDQRETVTAEGICGS
jgi:hypothetical protein